MLVVWKLDRLGLSARGVGLRVLAGQGAQIDTTTAAGRLVFGIFAALAEFERELIRERTVAGLKAAMAHRDTSVSRTVPRTRYQAGDALPVRRPAGPVARAGPEGPRLLTAGAGGGANNPRLPAESLVVELRRRQPRRR